MTDVCTGRCTNKDAGGRCGLCSDVKGRVLDCDEIGDDFEMIEFLQY